MTSSIAYYSPAARKAQWTRREGLDSELRICCHSGASKAPRGCGRVADPARSPTTRPSSTSVAMSKHHLESVYRKWFSAFESLRRLPPICTIDDNDRFVKNSGGISEIMIPSLALGMMESFHLLAPAQLDGFMERMLRSRISRRMLAEQHIALSDSLDDPFHFPESEAKGTGTIGIIYTHLSCATLVRKAAKLLRDVFRKENPDIERIPPVTMDGNLDSILITIVERPPAEDLVIRIADSGGGITDALVYPPTKGESAPSMTTSPSESRQIIPEFTHSSASASSASGLMYRGDSSAVVFEALQLEILAAAARQGLSDQQQRPAATVQQDLGERREGDHGSSSFYTHSGLSTVGRLEALKRTRHLKERETVERLADHSLERDRGPLKLCGPSGFHDYVVVAASGCSSSRKAAAAAAAAKPTETTSGSREATSGRTVPVRATCG
ncbi:unnamed protein product [Tilletia caries]|nr:unnamed protein product [Tilletia caries]